MTTRPTDESCVAAESLVHSSPAQLRAELGRLRDRLGRLEQQLAVEERAGRKFPAGPFAVVVGQAGSERLALPLAEVDEVVPLARCSELPGSPFWVVGLLDLRGRLVPVVDVAARIEGRPRLPGLDELIVIASSAGRPVGLLVKSIDSIHRISPDELDTNFATGERAGYVAGVFEENGTATLLVDIPSLVEAVAAPAEAVSGDR